MEEPTDDMLRRPTLDSAWGRSSLEGRSTASGPTPSEPEPEPVRSLRLRFVTGFFLLASISVTASLLLLVQAAVTDADELRALIADQPLTLFTTPLTAASTWITWRLLRQRRRLGAVVAAIPFLNSLVGNATAGAVEWYNLLFPALSVLFIASIWKELE
jgi:hypothetical protein